MSILDEFLILIKSNAKDTEKDIDSLGKKVKQVQENVDNTDKNVKNLGTSFGDLVKAFVSADAIEGFFNKVKEFATDAAGYENKLWRLSKLTGQNASDIDAWDQALQQFGAPAGQFLSFLEQANSQAVQMGQGGAAAFENLIKHVQGVSAQYKDASVSAREFGFFQAFGNEQMAESLALIPDDKLESILDYWRRARGLTQENIEEAHKYEVSLQKVGATWIRLFNDLAPDLEWLLDKFDELVNAINGSSSSSGHGVAYPSNTPTHGTAYPSNSPLGIRSNNPGNLQPGGSEKIFSTMQDGLAAEDAQIQRYRQRGISTLAGIALDPTYGWPDKAHATSWLDAVSRASGFGVNQELDLTDPSIRARIAKGINVAEGDGAANNFMAMKNGLAAADSSPLNSMGSGGGKTVNVNVGNVTINTQATDAQGIAVDFAGQLHAHVRSAAAFLDDPHVN